MYPKIEVKRFNQAFDELKNLGSEYPVNDFQKYLGEQNCYNNWTEQLRYFFFRYEEYLVKQNKSNIKEEVWNMIWNDSPLKSIEHIYPQNPYQNWKDWKGKMGKGANTIEKNTHRLGNLMLLTPNVNSSCGAKPFNKKKDIYKKQMLFLKDEIVKKNDWNINSIKQREKKLIKWAKETWCDL